MEDNSLLKSLNKLIEYIEKAKFQGYDPYDILKSPFCINKFGKILPALAIQFHKRNPFNIRPLLKIKKDINPKAMGLFLKSYCMLYKYFKNDIYLQNAHQIYEWLKNNHSKSLSGYCWGYNFDWANPKKYWPAYTPSVVVTSFVIDGIYEFFLITKNKEAKQIIHSASNYITKDIPVSEFEKGICYSYSHLSIDCCYNASLFAAEILAKSDQLSNTHNYTGLIKQVLNFVISRQKSDGSWNYSLNIKSQSERNQIDFHQGFILVSIYKILQLTKLTNRLIINSIEKGLKFYFKNQFYNSGQSLWRLPKKWPADIHCQSQGILTFTILNSFDNDYIEIAKRIASWTIENMQSNKGYFYYRKYRFFIDKTPYIRWGQAWMLLALSTLLISLGENNDF